MRSFAPALLTGLSMMLLVACGPATQSNRQPPQTAVSANVVPTDGGPPDALPNVPLTRKGVIVPGDPATKGIGESPPMGTSTGTNGRAVGPTLGSPTNH